MTAMDSHVVDPLGRRRWQAEPGSEKEEDKQKASWLCRRLSSVCRRRALGVEPLYRGIW